MEKNNGLLNTILDQINKDEKREKSQKNMDYEQKVMDHAFMQFSQMYNDHNTFDKNQIKKLLSE